MASNTTFQIINKKPFFAYDNEDICKWIQSLNLDIYLNNFKSNKITGADLCFLNNEDLKFNMDISNIHDRYTILREIKKLLHSKIKFNLNFEDNKVSINLDYDANITLEKIFPLVCNVLGLSKSVWDRVIIENNDRELICGYCKIFELVVLYPQKYLNLYIRLIEKGKNINFNNYKNQHPTDYDIKTSKSINSAKIEYNTKNIEGKLNFSNSNNDFNKFNFANNKTFEFNKEKASNINEEMALRNDNFLKEKSQRKSISGTNEFYSSLRKPQETYSIRTFEEKQNNEMNKYPYEQIENTDENYRNNTNPDVYENRNKFDNERDVNFRRELHDDFKIEKKSRPLSVNNFSSRYLNRDEEDFSNQRNGVSRDDGLINEQNQETRNKNNYISNESSYRISSKRLDLEQKASSPSDNKFVEHRNIGDNHMRNLSNNETILNSKRNFISSINNNANKGPSASMIPETNFNYDSNSFKKYNNFDENKDNLDHQNKTEFNKNDYDFTATEGNIRANPYSEINVDNRLDEIIDISKSNYKVNKYNVENDNNFLKNSNLDNLYTQSNPLKARYLSEKRMFRDKKDDQKDFINNLKKYQQEHRSIKNKYTNVNNQLPNENTDPVNINSNNNIANKNSSNYISSNLTRSSNYVDNYRDNYKHKDIEMMQNSTNEKNISNQYRDNKLISERSNNQYPIGFLGEKNYTENIQRDIKDSSSRKETFVDHRNQGDSYSIKNYKDNVNIISDRTGIDKNNNMNTYGNKDDRRANDDFSNTNKDFNKYEISKTNNNLNANFGMSSSNATKFDKSAKGTDKIKFSNINNLEFFNQKYYK